MLRGGLSGLLVLFLVIGSPTAFAQGGGDPPVAPKRVGPPLTDFPPSRFCLESAKRKQFTAAQAEQARIVTGAGAALQYMAEMRIRIEKDRKQGNAYALRFDEADLARFQETAAKQMTKTDPAMAQELVAAIEGTPVVDCSTETALAGQRPRFTAVGPWEEPAKLCTQKEIDDLATRALGNAELSDLNREKAMRYRAFLARNYELLGPETDKTPVIIGAPVILRKLLKDELDRFAKLETSYEGGAEYWSILAALIKQRKPDPCEQPRAAPQPAPAPQPTPPPQPQPQPTPQPTPVTPKIALPAPPVFDDPIESGPIPRFCTPGQRNDYLSKELSPMVERANRNSKLAGDYVAYLYSFVATNRVNVGAAEFNAMMAEVERYRAIYGERVRFAQALADKWAEAAAKPIENCTPPAPRAADAPKPPSDGPRVTPRPVQGKPCPPGKGRAQVTIGSNAKIGSGARAKDKAVSTLAGIAGGLLGGGGGGGAKDGPRLAKCKIKDKQMTVFTDPGTGIALKVGAKQDGDTLFVFANIDKSPDSGTFQTAFMEDPDGNARTPDKVDICELWGEWSLSVSWTKTTYVNDQVVSRESGGYSRAGDFHIPGTLSSDAAPEGLWRQLGFSNASHGARMIAMRYPVPADGEHLVIHVTRPGQNPVISQPFDLLLNRGQDGFTISPAPPHVCTGEQPEPVRDDGIAPVTGGTTTTRPPTPATPMTPVSPGGNTVTRDGIAPVTSSVTTGGECPWPSGKISSHMVDAEVYSALLYGTSDTFTGLADMLAQLKAKVAPHYDPTGKCGRCIEQLDVWGHGDTGGGYISFGPDDAQIGTTAMGANVDENLAGIGALMCIGGKVVINQCKAGTGRKGTEALQALADKIGVSVSGPTDKIKGCRIFGGAFTDYREMTPGPGAKTPAQNKSGPVSTAPP